MVRDVRAMIINESINRMMAEYIECPDLEYTVYGPTGEVINLEEMKKLVALNATMRRIINSAVWN